MNEDEREALGIVESALDLWNNGRGHSDEAWIRSAYNMADALRRAESALRGLRRETTVEEQEALSQLEDAIMAYASAQDEANIGLTANKVYEAIDSYREAVLSLRTVQSEPTPPDGWFPYGSHAPYPWVGQLEFSEETDDVGMPLWERPVQGEPTFTNVVADLPVPEGCPGVGVQGEPSAARILAATKAIHAIECGCGYDGEHSEADIERREQIARAALRADAEAEGGNR